MFHSNVFPTLRQHPTRMKPRANIAMQCGTLAALLMALSGTSVQAAAPALPDGLTEQKIDDVVSRAQKAFDVPGVAVGVIHDGKIVFAKGYGRREDNEKSGKVDPNTLFAIGSNSKEFTATALATLVDKGKLKWTDRVIDVMPEFKVSDPWITREFRVSDLLTHHSGMGLGAGDMMLFSHSTFTRKDVLAGLPYMPFTGRFRADYAYNNLLYVVAGALVEKISGQTWEHYVQTHLIDAAGLPACQSTFPVKGQTDVAAGQGSDGVLPDRATLEPVAVAPAGGVWCSVNGMNRWVQTLLNGGRTVEGRKIISLAQRDALWAPSALIPVPDSAAKTQSHFRAYGYGWFMEDFYGLKRVWHTGTISGMVSYVSMLPEKNSGLVVLTNHYANSATASIALTMSSLIATGKSADWVTYWQDETKKAEDKAAKEASTTGPGSPARPFIALPASDLKDYVGVYHDAWRGDIRLSLKGNDLVMTFGKADGLAGTLSALPHDLFVAKWQNRAEDAEDDSYVQFERNTSGKVTGFHMQVVGSDFSFDAQDLHPLKVSDQ
ncbi:serine hydrolase [Acetobacter cerevisiae]|uniref:serine hydrolase n=1 Tax=Acetobacter cerevisiae TaxID=178900 RepID=UPI00209F5E20|nr:serine hydrolase [Acetobacter cerevisiae]MCP1270874.1 serine hydrolase [Acetobacter cerevisiae]MCP1278793.1 serine hydrolase [Acetobacter cerevisiae]